MDPRKTAGSTRGGHEDKTPPKSDPSGFGVFGLSPELLHAAEAMGWTTPTPVQLEAIPPAMSGYDLIALAQTGTGKTGAYLLPVLNALRTMPKAKPLNTNCVILAPTRELVQQIDVQVKALTEAMDLRSMTIFGGVSDRPQISQLMSGVEVVSATPGRLLDLIGQRMMHFESLTHCVLDEADRMFDMGFINDLRKILNRMPSRRQTLLFSATMPPEIQRLTREFLFDPQEVRLSVALPPPELSHEVWELHSDDKNKALLSLLDEDHESVLVFTRTKHRADRVSRQLSRSGEDVAVLHGDRSQRQRDTALARFKAGEARVLVATDVASRGLDITGIGLVINYDPPLDPEDYVHRVGRTARAKRKGLAVTLMIDDEIKYIRRIEKLLKQKVTRRGVAVAEEQAQDDSYIDEPPRSKRRDRDDRTGDQSQRKPRRRHRPGSGSKQGSVSSTSGKTQSADSGNRDSRRSPEKGEEQPKSTRSRSRRSRGGRGRSKGSSRSRDSSERRG